MNWWNVLEFVIGASIVAAITASASLRLFYPRLTIPKNSPWQRLRLRLGWRWDYLLQILDITARDNVHVYRQPELRLPVRNGGGRTAEGCSVALEIKRLPPSHFVQPQKQLPGPVIGPISGYDSVFHNPRWVDMMQPSPQQGSTEADIVPGAMAWFSFIRVYAESNGPIIDFNCPGEILTSPSSMAVRLKPGANPIRGLLTVYSKNTLPTRCYFSLRNSGKTIVLSLDRMLDISLGAVGIWFSVPFAKVNYSPIEISSLTELPRKVFKVGL